MLPFMAVPFEAICTDPMPSGMEPIPSRLATLIPIAIPIPGMPMPMFIFRFAFNDGSNNASIFISMFIPIPIVPIPMPIPLLARARFGSNATLPLDIASPPLMLLLAGTDMSRETGTSFVSPSRCAKPSARFRFLADEGGKVPLLDSSASDRKENALAPAAASLLDSAALDCSSVDDSCRKSKEDAEPCVGGDADADSRVCSCANIS